MSYIMQLIQKLIQYYKTYTQAYLKLIQKLIQYYKTHTKTY